MELRCTGIPMDESLWLRVKQKGLPPGPRIIAGPRTDFNANRFDEYGYKMGPQGQLSIPWLRIWKAVRDRREVPIEAIEILHAGYSDGYSDPTYSQEAPFDIVALDWPVVEPYLAPAAAANAVELYHTPVVGYREQALEDMEYAKNHGASLPEQFVQDVDAAETARNARMEAVRRQREEEDKMRGQSMSAGDWIIKLTRDASDGSKCREARLRGTVVQRLEGHLYEVQVTLPMSLNSSTVNVVLRTKVATFSSTGACELCVLGAPEYTTMTRKDGFEQKTLLFTEDPRRR